MGPPARTRPASLFPQWTPLPLIPCHAVARIRGPPDEVLFICSVCSGRVSALAGGSHAAIGGHVLPLPVSADRRGAGPSATKVNRRQTAVCGRRNSKLTGASCCKIVAAWSGLCRPRKLSWPRAKRRCQRPESLTKIERMIRCGVVWTPIGGRFVDGCGLFRSWSSVKPRRLNAKPKKPVPRPQTPATNRPNSRACQSGAATAHCCRHRAKCPGELRFRSLLRP